MPSLQLYNYVANITGKLYKYIITIAWQQSSNLRVVEKLETQISQKDNMWSPLIIKPTKPGGLTNKKIQLQDQMTSSFGKLASF